MDQKQASSQTDINNRIKEIEILNKIIQQDLEEKKAILFQNELQLTRLKLVVKATKIGLWDTEFLIDDPFNPDNVFVWSEDFRQLLGFRDESDFPNVLGSWSSRIHPDDRERVFAAVQEHLLDTTGQIMLDVEYRMMKKDGEYAYFKTMGTTMRDEQGRPTRVVGSQLDVTEIRSLIDEAQSRRIEAEEANKAKSSFLSAMSHEIRTPMNAILGIAEIELMNENHLPSTRASFEKIFVSGDMLMGIINDILDLSKIEAGKMELMNDKYSIENLVINTAQLNMMRIGSKPISFELDVAPDMPAYLFGDELRIKQILNNLLSNAFKYSDEGKVVLSLSYLDTNLIIKVSDTGQGMSKEHLERLFDEYAQFNLEANRLKEGTGLGMSITHNLVRLMGGDIAVESELGKGSVFTVRLPQGNVECDVLGQDVSENLHKFQADHNPRMIKAQIFREYMPYGNVLVVDDVDTNIHVAKGLMAPYALQIDSAASGFATIEKIKDGKVYDIIFMDHMMPRMDGVETTKQLRAMGYTKPIVALTANAVVGQLDIFLENGFDDFISKPIDIRMLNAVLNKLIRDKQPSEVIEAASRDQVFIQHYQPKSPLATRDVHGLNIAEGIDQFGGGEGSYINILRSYTANTRKLVAEIEVLNEGNKDEYKTPSQSDKEAYEIAFHSIKGSSYGICAEPLGDFAARLEDAVKREDFEYIRQHNPAFLETARRLIDDIDALIIFADPNNKNPKPTKPRIDTALMLRLAEACNTFDMGKVDLIMKEIDSFSYEADNDLVDWLQKNVEMVNFDEIAQRLLEYKEDE